MRLRLADGSNVEGRAVLRPLGFLPEHVRGARRRPRRAARAICRSRRPCRPARSARWCSGRAPFQLGGRAHVVTAGTDFRWIDGDSDELTYALATGLTPLVHRVAGGTQRFVGVFAQDLIEVTPKLQLTLSARVDSWRNYDAHNLETTLATGLPTAANRATLPDKSDTAVSPRVAALVSRDRSRLGLGQRQQGIPRADAQGALQPVPRRRGAHALQRDARPRAADRGRGAASASRRRSSITVRGTLFNNRVNDPIANVTVPSTTCRRPRVRCRRRDDVPAAAEPRQHEHLRVPDRCGVSRERALGRLGRVRLRHRQGARVDRSMPRATI